MNVVAVVVLSTVMVVAAGSFVVKEITHPGCRGDPMGGVPASTSAYHYRLTILDEIRDGPVRTCMYDTAGRKVFDQEFVLPDDTARYWDIYLAQPLQIWIVDGPWDDYAKLDRLHYYVHDDACAHDPELLYKDTRDSGYLISGDCNDYSGLPERKPGEQRLQTSAMLPTGEGPNLPGAGGAVALSVAGGGVLVLVIHFRRPLLWAFWGLFTRIMAPKVLDQGVRAQIHQLIQQEPGIRPTEIAERLELAAGQTVHHLRVLTQAQALSLVHEGFARHYFVRGQHAPQRMRQIAALRSDSVAKLHRALTQHPGAPLSTLANLGGLSRPRASRLARRLMDVGLARAERHGKNVRLYPLN